MKPVIVIRPQPGCDATVAAARALGLEAYGFPLFAVRPVSWDPPPADSFDAILLGSANAPRHAGQALDRYRGKPTYTVGAVTAEVARAAGLEVVVSGAGGIEAVLPLLRPEHRHILRLSGRERMALSTPPGVRIEERVVYASERLPLPSELGSLLVRQPALVLLHSAEAADHFAALCDSDGVDRSQVSLAALGPRVAEAAGEGWAALRTAAAPNDTALLALAQEMCQDRLGEIHDGEIRELAGLMQDETLGQPLPLPRPRRSLGAMLLIAGLGFALGGAAAGWLAHSGYLPFALPGNSDPEISSSVSQTASSPAQASAAIAPGQAAALGTVETRLALIEDRLARINGEATAAAGNAARSEALLVAYAARRRIDKGEPLDFVAEQLKLRFGGAQPDAVQTIISAAKTPVTLDDLSGQLEAAAPALAGPMRDESTWSRARRELASLFVIRRAPVPSATPATRVARARLMLARGQIDEAIIEVERLPGAAGAQGWIETARRYEATQRALDVIETAAMLEPRALRDGAGRSVEQTSPLAAPAQAAAEPVTPTSAGTATP